MYERRGQPLLPWNKFYRRLGVHAAIAGVIIVISLFLGMLGYHYLGNLGWVDSLLNASMILGGMGPVNVLTSDAAKVFASIYALYSGAIFLATVGIIIAPIFHRLLHHFNLITPEDEEKQEEQEDTDKQRETRRKK